MVFGDFFSFVHACVWINCMFAEAPHMLRFNMPIWVENHPDWFQCTFLLITIAASDEEKMKLVFTLEFPMKLDNHLLCDLYPWCHSAVSDFFHSHIYFDKNATFFLSIACHIYRRYNFYYTFIKIDPVKCVQDKERNKMKWVQQQS